MKTCDRLPVLNQSESQTLAASLAPKTQWWSILIITSILSTKTNHLGVVRKACLPTTEPEVTATTCLKSRWKILMEMGNDLTLGVKAVQQLKLSRCDVAKVHGLELKSRNVTILPFLTYSDQDHLEQEEDELAAKAFQVEGGRDPSGQAGHLGHNKDVNQVQEIVEGKKI